VLTPLYSDLESCQFYDLEHPFSPEDPDFRFYSTLCRDTKGPILELGCGNGRLLIPILRDGADIEGLDVSRPMIEALKERLRIEGLKTQLHEQSMESFHTARSYQLIFIAVTTFHILDTEKAQVACLKRCREHLASGGRVVLDLDLRVEDVVADGGFPRLFRRFETEGKEVLVYQCVERKSGSPQELVLYRYEIYGSDGILERTLLRSMPWRRLTVEEFRNTARKAGFSRVEFFGSYAFEPLTPEHEMAVVFLAP